MALTRVLYLNVYVFDDHTVIINFQNAHHKYYKQIHPLISFEFLAPFFESIIPHASFFDANINSLIM